MGKRTVVQNLEPSTEATVEQPAAPAALPSLETLLNVLGIAWDEFQRRLAVLQSHNPQVPLTAEQVADLLRNMVTRAHLQQVFLKAGQLVVETVKAGHGENTSDPSASA